VTSSRPTPRRPSREQRREALLAVAAREFAGGGWAETSVDQIARAAGVSAPVLYTHFGSKRGLFLVLLERHGAALLDRIGTAVSAQPTPETQLRASIDAFLDFVANDNFAWRTLFRDPVADLEIATRQRAAQVETTHLIARMFVAGGAPAENEAEVTLVAQLFKSALNGLAAWWWDHPELDQQRLATLAHQTLWHGVGSLPGTQPQPKRS
jgi:AcrR family transcriptional regulator